MDEEKNEELYPYTKVYMEGYDMGQKDIIELILENSIALRLTEYQKITLKDVLEGIQKELDEAKSNS